MEMKQCSRCFELKSALEYSPSQGRCKACRNEVRRLETLKRQGGRAPLPAHLVPVVNYLKTLTREYTGAPLSVPVRALHNTVLNSRACILQRVDGVDWYCLASRRGERRLTLASTGPLDLLESLRDLGLEVVLPTNTEVQRV